MKFPRAAGILLHPTSLPGPYGIGDLGAEAYRFADYLHSAGIKIWQVLPLNPTGYGDSPYQSFSAFAGNPLLISLDNLHAQGLLSENDLRYAFSDNHGDVDFGAVIPRKFAALQKAATSFYGKSGELNLAFQQFVAANATWLDDYALFMAAKDAHDLVVWTAWDRDLAARKPDALAKWRRQLANEIAAYKFWQFEFFRQWRALKAYCNQRHIRIMGDIPIYVAHDSADVWARPDLFWLDPQGHPLKVAGVPPDYFSATGQLWGNPIYRWDLMRQSGYAWWIDRFRTALTMFDLVRVDHFRGFEAYWEIPGGENTAIRGQWVKGPGANLFEVVTKSLGELPIIAENLGVITPEVEAIRHRFGFPGMAILQFAFSIDPMAPTFRPHNYERQLVAYTGGHDNDTMFGWWRSGAADSTRTQAEVEREHNDAAAYFGVSVDEMDRNVNWIYIRAVMMSVADTVLFPMQDVLGAGGEARMNLPGSLGRNWKWRMPPNSLRPDHAQRLAEFSKLYDR
ncbi:MAG TPA: 4-alpha-glucanotransferase [Candidatus Koribacter sp.]|jgi:4-alpha-glucanotransferase